MSDKKKTTGAKVEPEEEIRCGEVIATIFQCQVPAGFVYRSFTLSRCWKSVASGKPQQGNSFFDANEQDLFAAIKAASDHIRAKNGGHADHGSGGPASDDSIE